MTFCYTFSSRWKDRDGDVNFVLKGEPNEAMYQNIKEKLSKYGSDGIKWTKKLNKKLFKTLEKERSVHFEMEELSKEDCIALLVEKVKFEEVGNDEDEKEELYSFVITCYTYIDGEPDDSGISCVGSYQTEEKAKNAAKKYAKKLIKDEKEMNNKMILVSTMRCPYLVLDKSEKEHADELHCGGEARHGNYYILEVHETKRKK